MNKENITLENALELYPEYKEALGELRVLSKRAFNIESESNNKRKLKHKVKIPK